MGLSHWCCNFSIKKFHISTIIHYIIFFPFLLTTYLIVLSSKSLKMKNCTWKEVEMKKNEQILNPLLLLFCIRYLTPSRSSLCDLFYANSFSFFISYSWSTEKDLKTILNDFKYLTCLHNRCKKKKKNLKMKKDLHNEAWGMRKISLWLRNIEPLFYIHA